MKFMLYSIVFGSCLSLVIIPHLVFSTELKEGFFNNSSAVRLATSLNLHGHIGLSFKSCIGGELFSQIGNGAAVSLSVHPEGLLFYSSVNGVHFDVRLPTRLLNNAWHAVNLIYRLGNLTLYAGGHQLVVANSTYNSEILNTDFNNKNVIFQVGAGFHGCILEGPSIVFNSSNILQSVNVNWGPCPLRSPGCGKLDFCYYDPCMNGGSCVSFVDHYECACPARYSGSNCEVDNGSICDRNPCQNGGRCYEDDRGNFFCACDASHAGTYCETPTNWLPCSANSNPCLSNGTCRVLATSLDRPECVCLPGFRGSYCEININECQSNPCRNGGTCYDGDNSFTCVCARTGYTGERCEENVNECVPINPCLNNGMCYDNYGSYTCHCPQGFSGQNCELNINECASGPCKNGGTCEDQVGSYKCACKFGFTGVNCDIPEITKRSNGLCGTISAPCAPEYDCLEVGNAVTCICKPGYQGTPPNCTEVFACAINMCLNGGTCIDLGGVTRCNCPPMYTGKNCGLLNDCQSSPCLYGGTCHSSAQGYTCTCPADRVGERCERDVADVTLLNTCSSNPCRNNGLCIAINTHEYRCECPKGFAGINCDLAIGSTVSEDKSMKSLSNVCSSNPCNNGTCLSASDSYHCECPPGIIGDYCEIDINECDENRTICNNGICLNVLGSFQCFCTPGFAGNLCNIDIDECLSTPCKNNGTCENKINHFKCHCQPGFAGNDCSIDVDECASNPCQYGGTCVDGIANFACYCPPGLTGRQCEINVDDCESAPCLNGGRCKDGINSYTCDCDETGFDGLHCEHNIDDCLSNPCQNEAPCVDLIREYRCDCYSGYQGVNCEEDINECEKNPCLNGGTCYEHSNRSLYLSNETGLPEYFQEEFNITRAAGYECVCVPGIVGANCEKNIDECQSSPCVHGECQDLINGFRCECNGGFEGSLCEIEINECEKFKPCVNGSCEDRKNDYYCQCIPGYGGKNCSVELIGCESNKCMNNGKCIPYLEKEIEHKFNCSCDNGFRGKICEKITTMSLKGSSRVLINRTRDEGYDLNFKFKTTLPNGLLALGKGLTYYMLELANGRLNLRSSLLNKLEGVFVGSGLNDSKWHKVFVAINSSHLVLGANEEQTIYPISLNEANSSHTSFPTTYLGGTTSNLRQLVNGPSFVGCIEDVLTNGEYVIPQDADVSPISLVDIEEGCQREEQCNPNKCYNGGYCTDLWRNFSCTCVRPFLGHTCQYNLTAATFGHENITNSIATVVVNDQARRAIRNIVDISMFIRTRQDKGFIFYLGSEPGKTPVSEETFIIAQLENGELKGRIQFGGSFDTYGVGSVRVDNGYSHLIQVVRNGTLVHVRINNTEYFRKAISASDQLNAELLYLGGMPGLGPSYPESSIETNQAGLTDHPANPQTPRRLARQIEASAAKTDPPTKSDQPITYFKGIIQDVQISNGSRTMVVEFFPLKQTDLVVPPSFGNVSFNNSLVLMGEISDNTCASNPCFHDGNCTVTWNDFSCNCPHGYKGKSCLEMEFCQLQDCPAGSECRNLEDGYECLSNVTLRGVRDDVLFYNLIGDVKPDSVRITYRSATGGTLLHITGSNGHYFSVSAFKDEITVTWRLDNTTAGEQQRFKKENPDGNWTTITLKMRNGKISGGFNGPDPEFNVMSFPMDAWKNLVGHGRIIVGGLDEVAPVTVSPRLAYTIDSVLEHADNALLGNAVDFPLGSNTAGEFFKGCLGEIRIGNILLPFYTAEVLYNANFTATSHFSLEKLPVGVANLSGCVLCFEEECKNGGRCENPHESIKCSCAIGFDGHDCSHDIDWCHVVKDEEPCLNNGTCVDGVSNYTCKCLNGFEGARCETNIDECLSSPCLHGTCIDQVAGFECECNESFTGKLCDQFKIVTCADGLCKNGSTCLDEFNTKTGDNFTCKCADGFVSRLCDVPYCLQTSCLNRGTCRIWDVSAPRCDCPPGFEGLRCEVNIDECASTPCLNGGVCNDLVNGFSCECKGTGFEGSHCENDIDECAENIQLCGETRICNNRRGSFKCTCSPNGTISMCGTYCNITDPCTPNNPCENGGTCTEQCHEYSDYKCECPDGYTGKNCTDHPLHSGPSPGDVAIIAGPIAAFLLLAAGVGLTAFLMMARKKRATRGTYSPSQQEYCNPRVEMDNVLKPPPEERLI